MKPCISIFGPTASGKSALALSLARDFNGVIISADSMQIYRGMNIGTAKPTAEEMEEIPHRMIDICDPADSFSVYDYKQKAENEIEQVLSCGMLPIVVGGTGLYLDALFYNTQFGEMQIDPNIRENLAKEAVKLGNGELLARLKRIDPETAFPLHEKDTKRILRALEVYYSTGKTLSAFKRESHLIKPKFDYLKISLVFSNRENLYLRINNRVDQMMKMGLLEETRKLIEDGSFSGKTAPQAIGYKELIPFFKGESSLETCIEKLKQKTRNYAKRQLTWFRRYTDAQTVCMDCRISPYERVKEITNKFLEE